MAIWEFCLEGQDGDGKSQRVRSVEVKGEPEKVVVQNEKLRTNNNNSKLKSENVDEVETSITDKVMAAEDEGKRVELVMSEVQSRWGELLAGVAEVNQGLGAVLKGGGGGGRVGEAEHENIAVVPPEDEELAAAAEEIFG